KQLEDFAAYCFNKSHAACYGLIAYWTAYLKAHYPDAFMAALMTSDADDIDRLAIEITECRHMGIDVLLPSVNESYVEFAVVPNKSKIRFGMSAIKNVGVGAVEEIVNERDENGKFASVMDFLERVDTRKVNRKTWESLIKAGAFEEFGQSRGDLLFNLDGLLALGSKIHKEKETNQADLFGGMDNAAESIAPTFNFDTAPEQMSEHDMLLNERELLGLYLSKHPLDGYGAYLEEHALPLEQINDTMDGKTVTIGGVVTSIRSITTKNGARMAFVKIEDKSAECELIVFPGVYEKLNAVWQQDQVIIAKGKINYKDRDGNMGQELKILVDQANQVTEADAKAYQPKGKKPKPPKGTTPSKPSKADLPPPPPPKVIDDYKEQSLYVQIKDPSDAEKLKELKEIAGEHPGDTVVILVLGEGDTKTALKMPFRVSLVDQLSERLKQAFSEECVHIK
ncbi:hypothetical protein KC973_03350, partial [Candidatus Saccharibacteria bacterium]|nr:hypothetical protein [Candidatus Saccharibacteria bacterium]